MGNADDRRRLDLAERCRKLREAMFPALNRKGATTPSERRHNEFAEAASRLREALGRRRC